MLGLGSVKRILLHAISALGAQVEPCGRTSLPRKLKRVIPYRLRAIADLSEGKNSMALAGKRCQIQKMVVDDQRRMKCGRLDSHPAVGF
jgi:hypothetical protein